MPGDVFARRFVPQVLKRNPPAVIYDGNGLVMLRTMAFFGAIFGPRMFDWVFSFVSGLPDLRKWVQAEEKKNKAI
jgi:hypothetical protein